MTSKRAEVSFEIVTQDDFTAVERTGSWAAEVAKVGTEEAVYAVVAVYCMSMILAKREAGCECRLCSILRGAANELASGLRGADSPADTIGPTVGSA